MLTILFTTWSLSVDIERIFSVFHVQSKFKNVLERWSN